MEYLVIIAMSLLFWLPLYVAAIAVKFSNLEIPKKFLFCVICLVLTYGTLGVIFPLFALIQMISSFLVHDWSVSGYKDLAGAFIQIEEVSAYVIFAIPILATFIVPFKLAPKWQGFVKSYC
jgi:uncharacterized membrane protein YcgQ (UPF0703/DUF1980 family)